MHALWKTFGPSHSIDTLVSYLANDGNQLGSTVWTFKDAIAGGASAYGASAVTDTGGLELVSDDASISFEPVNDEVKIKTVFDFESQNGPTHQSFSNDGLGKIVWATTGTDGKPLFEAASDDTGHLKLLVGQGDVVESVEILSDGTVKILKDSLGHLRSTLLTPDVKGSVIEVSSPTSHYEMQVNMDRSIHIVSHYIHSSGDLVESESHYAADGSMTGWERWDNSLSVWSYDAMSVGSRKQYIDGELYHQAVFYANGTTEKGFVREGVWTKESGTWDRNLSAPNGNDYDNNVLTGIYGIKIEGDGYAKHTTSGLPWASMFTGEYVKYAAIGEAEFAVPIKLSIGENFIDKYDPWWAGSSLRYLTIKDATGARDETYQFKDGVINKVYLLDAIEGSTRISFESGMVSSVSVHSVPPETIRSYIFGTFGEVTSQSGSTLIRYQAAGIQSEFNVSTGMEKHYWEDGTWSTVQQTNDGYTHSYYLTSGMLTRKTVEKYKGQLESITDYNADGSYTVEDFSSSIKSVLDYDATGQLIRSKTVDGDETRLVEYSNGRMTAETITNGDSIVATAYASDGSKVVTKSSPEQWATSVKSYDATGRLVQDKYFNDWVTSVTDFAIDGSSQEVFRTADGKHATNTITAAGDELRTEYSADGTLIAKSEQYADGHGSSLKYTDSGVLIYNMQRSASGESETREYSDDGLRLISHELRKADGSSFYVEFDELGGITHQGWDGADGSYGWEDFVGGTSTGEVAYGIDGDFSVKSLLNSGQLAGVSVGTSENDVVTVDSDVVFFAGRGGDDAVTMNGSIGVIAFNAGDGNDRFSVTVQPL